MVSRNEINTPLKDNFPSTHYVPSRMFGVEIELEGELPQEMPSSLPNWLVIPEGSLRGGWEYIFKRPTALVSAKQNVTALYEYLKEYLVTTSIRTSTHVHVSVLDYTHLQIYQIVSAYYLLEEVLVRTQPETRQSNLFTLRMSDAEGIFDGLIRSVQSGKFFFQFNLAQFKYGACNLASPSRRGSLEFRFLQAFTEAQPIINWLDIFDSLVAYGAETPIDKILNDYDGLSTRSFLSGIFGPLYADYLIGQYSSTEEVNRLLQTNYDNIVVLHNEITGRKFQLPEGYWNEDLIDDSTPVFSGAITDNTPLNGPSTYDWYDAMMTTLGD